MSVEMLPQFTTATAVVPRDGVARFCTAAVECPHTVLGRDEGEARLMLADHEWAVHGIGRTGARRG